MMPKQHQWWVNLPEKPQSQIVPGKQKMMCCTCMLWAAFWCLMPGNVVLSLCADRWRPKCPVCAIASRPCPGGGHPRGLCTSPSWVSEGQSQHSRTELEVGAYVLVSASGDNEQNAGQPRRAWKTPTPLPMNRAQAVFVSQEQFL